MKLVFQENPKFGDEQDVTQQIVAIEESIDKLLAEIKRFEVNCLFDFIQSNFFILVVHIGNRTSTNTFNN